MVLSRLSRMDSNLKLSRWRSISIVDASQRRIQIQSAPPDLKIRGELIRVYPEWHLLNNMPCLINHSRYNMPCIRNRQRYTEKIKEVCRET